MILAIASGLLFSVSATDMLAGQIGVAKGKRMPMVQVSGGGCIGCCFCLFFLQSPHIFSCGNREMYAVRARWCLQWWFSYCCWRFSEPCFFCMTESTCFRCHKKVGRITELENGLFCSLVRWQPPWYGNFYAVVCMSCWLEN